jgi:type IV pilus assembly protein PilA
VFGKASWQRSGSSLNAIIGILAAVGVVAYNGYTKSAKINASKSNQGAVTKYLAAEIQKCNIGTETSAMGGSLICDGRTATTIQTAALSTLSDFKNTYTPACQGVTDGSTAPTSTNASVTCAASGKGYTTITLGEGNDEGFLIVKTQYDESSSDVLLNKVEAE